MLTLTDKQYHALGEATRHYYPDGGDKVEVEVTREGFLCLRVFNGRLKPREIFFDRAGRETFPARRI